MNAPILVTGVIDATLDGVGVKQTLSFSGALQAGPASFGTSGASPTSYFRGAQDFLKACETLEPGVTPAAFGFDAAQCLELALKAYLLHVGVSEKDLRNPSLFGHDVSKAWAGCVSKGLALEATMPQWAFNLNAGHQSPYLFRYAQDNVGIVLAPKTHTLAELGSVMVTVQAATGVT